jgi:signal peptidase I
LIDRQFILAFDGRPAVVVPYTADDAALRPTAQPVAIGAQCLGVEVGKLRVFRDVYYTSPEGPRGRWAIRAPIRLGREEYFLLGDNSTISEDSRSWAVGPAVSIEHIVGKPFVVPLPLRSAHWGAWYFQVPDIARIRYIP